MIAVATGVAAAALAAPSALAQEITEDIYTSPETMAAFEQSLDRQQGEITLLDGDVVLDIPKSLYFLDAEDSERVLVDAWSNPSAEGTLGMIFAAGHSPLEPEVWGVEITWDPSGYVSDSDASTIDYDELLSTLQADTQAANQYRVSEGYPAMELVGWAAAPHYDAAGHRLYWAQELEVEGFDGHTLNYNIRVLGREGVLVMNFIAGMSALSAVEAATPDVLQVAQFAAGRRYEDFDPTTDRVAAYGLAGLIAGGVGVAALKKAGLLAIALAFLKKGWVVLVVAGSAILGGIRKLFGGKAKTS